MTPPEQETAENEIEGVVNAISESLEKMDVEALFQSYSNSPGFILVTTDGSIVDEPRAKNHHAEWFKSLSSLRVTRVEDEFTFLPGNTVICTWLGKFEMTLKTGEQLRIDKFGVTFVFREIDNRWKVIYQQSSALPPLGKSQRSSHWLAEALRCALRGPATDALETNCAYAAAAAAENTGRSHSCYGLEAVRPRPRSSLVRCVIRIAHNPAPATR